MKLHLLMNQVIRTQHEGNVDFVANDVDHNEKDRDEAISTLVDEQQSHSIHSFGNL